MSSISALKPERMLNATDDSDSSDEDENENETGSSSSSLEECENVSSEDDESYISYYSVDCLSVIEEETEDDVWNEISRPVLVVVGGSSRSRHCRSIDEECDDLPPSPPVRTKSQEFQRKIKLAAIEAQNPTKTTPFSSAADSGDSSSSSSSSSCSSAPLNDEEEDDFHVEGFTLGREEQRPNKSASLADTARINRLSLISIKTGEPLMCTASDDDEYTFVSCTTTDDMSVSDVGSSHHRRIFLDMQAMEEENLLEFSSSDHRRNFCNTTTTIGGVSGRRGSAGLADLDGLLPIPEHESSHGPDASSFSSSSTSSPHRQPLYYYTEVQKKLESKIADNKLLLSPLLQEQQASSSVKSNRLLALKHRLRLEHYSGDRRRKAFERSKELLGRNFNDNGNTTVRRHSSLRSSLLLQTSSKTVGAAVDNQPLQEDLARFGGMTRRESFKVSKNEFQKKFDKQIKPLVFRRRRSLSPIPCCRPNYFDQSDFMIRMTKSDGQLPVDLLEVEDDRHHPAEDENKTASNDDLVLDPMLEKKFKERQERFGGLRRRNSFSRSRRLLSKKFDRIQSRSKEGKERYGGLQRIKSYKQSRLLFEEELWLLDENDGSETGGSITTKEEDNQETIAGENTTTTTPSARKLKSSRSAGGGGWSDNLTRSRRYSTENEKASKQVGSTSSRLETSPDLRRARMHLSAFKTQSHSARQ